MSDDNITRYKLDPVNPPKTDWTAFDARTEAENTAAMQAAGDKLPEDKKKDMMRMMSQKINAAADESAALAARLNEQIRVYKTKTAKP